mgnify:CR=1 FL=1
MIIVTGASRGIGKAITERLIEKGEEVVGLARSVNGLNIKAIECDVSDYTSVKNASREVKKLKKPVKAFINAAGVASMNMAVTTDEATVQKLIQINLVGTIYCCQLFAPIMLRQKNGSFINFSTIAVALALKGESVYAASKAGMVGMSKSLAYEVASRGITVNVVAPGFIATAMTDKLADDRKEAILAQIPAGRMGAAEDIASAVAFLASDGSGYVTGSTLHVNGGMAMI